MNAANIYIGLASLITVFTASLRFIALHFVPGAESLIFGSMSLLLLLGVIAVSSLLIPNARNSIKKHKTKPFVYLSLFIIILYIGFAASVIIFPPII